MLVPSLFGLSVLAATTSALPGSVSPRSSSSPTVTVKNGTYIGKHNAHYDQDLFLGIPYAQQPVGNLRFAIPHSLNETWSEPRDAKEYSDICVGYGTDSIWYPQSEACLTLNVIRDSSVDETSSLPVGVWIHGGGFYQGSGADQRYNMSAIVANAQRIGKPFIAVTINYRLSTWGFLNSAEIREAGATNLGLRDQRLALHWIQENIASFGGDPKKVTIWGESAGGMSVGNQLIAYGGRDDGLFRAGIMESGGSIAASPGNTTAYQSQYDDIVSKAGCATARDTLQCLREVPFESLNAIFNTTTGDPAYSFWPTVDGDFLREWGSVQLDKGEFVKVPIISGTNTDEGASFGPTGINTTQQFYNYLTGGASGFRYPPAIAKEILDLYPDDPSQGIPEFLGNQRVPSKGWQWRRTSAYAGDYSMHANRRRQTEVWAEHGIPAYAYRFNMRSGNADWIGGAQHFEEVAFVFRNFEGLGYHYGLPFEGMPERYKELSTLMASMWASFIVDLDPNSGVESEVYWEMYGANEPVDIVFDANVTGLGYIEDDTWRKEGIDFLNSISRVLWR
ncbi:Alpha/Beta hydrolase protein [Aspergillus foveolatus]|uniref:Alpha/Beta hydrolase protein n=1 Tax=Aspergillus foveolatus TaxID=210207 RepID=UPI003CCDDA50